MRFKGVSREDKRRDQEAWEAWLNAVKHNSKRARFATRLVELIEQRVGSPQPHVAVVAERAMSEAAAQFKTPLTPEHLREVIMVLFRHWHYGPGLRNWALSKGYVAPSDR